MYEGHHPHPAGINVAYIDIKRIYCVILENYLYKS